MNYLTCIELAAVRSLLHTSIAGGEWPDLRSSISPAKFFSVSDPMQPVCRTPTVVTPLTSLLTCGHADSTSRARGIMVHLTALIGSYSRGMWRFSQFQCLTTRAKPFTVIIMHSYGTVSSFVVAGRSQLLILAIYHALAAVITIATAMAVVYNCRPSW